VHDGLLLVLLLGPGPNTTIPLPAPGNNIIHPMAPSTPHAPPSAIQRLDSPLEASLPKAVHPGRLVADDDDSCAAQRAQQPPESAGEAEMGVPEGGMLYENDESCVVYRPKQSFEFSGEAEVEVCGDRGILRVDRLPGVVRRDNVRRLGVQECRDEGAAGCILAERLLWEVAYKMARASKYGS
jgi:hypothetical protein